MQTIRGYMKYVGVDRRDRLEAVTVDDAAMSDELRHGIGKNKPTAEHVGGAALPSTMIGAIAGGARGAAIGVAAGAGAGKQVLARAKKVKAPAEPLLSSVWRNQLGVGDYGISRNGRPFHKTNWRFRMPSSVAGSLARRERPAVGPDSNDDAMRARGLKPCVS